jgi:hypothetical protein
VADAEARPGRPRPWQQAILSLGVIAAVGIGVVNVAATNSIDAFTRLDFIAATAASISLALTGALLAWRLPSHPVGWLLWASGCLFAFADSQSGVATVIATSDPTLASWLVVLGGAAWVPAIVTVAVLLPLVFPTGRLPSRRWRIVVAIGLLSAAFSAAQDLFTPFPVDMNAVGLVNPLGTTGTVADLASLLGGLSSVAGVVCLPLIAASLVMRFRQASGVERAQLKWLAAAVAMAGLALAIAIVAQLVPGALALAIGNLAYLIAFVGLALLPVAIGIAVLRYRLYDIDLIIRRTAVYVPLTGILAGLYAASIALLQRLFITATGGPSDGAIIASTLILASLFTPIKNWLQARVDRRFRDDRDAERLFDQLIGRVATAEWAPDPVRTLRAFLAIAVESLGASGGRALREVAGRPEVVASLGSSERAALGAAIEYGGRQIGRIEIGPPARGRPYRPGDAALIEDAGRRLAEAMIEGRLATQSTDGPPA